MLPRFSERVIPIPRSLGVRKRTQGLRMRFTFCDLCVLCVPLLDQWNGLAIVMFHIRPMWPTGGRSRKNTCTDVPCVP